MPHHKHLFRLALGSHLLLLLFMTAWYTILAPAEYSLGLALGLWGAPLLLPLPGLLRAKPYTFAWSGFVLMLLLCHGLTVIVVDPAIWGLAAIELLLVCTALISGTLYARREGRSLGLGIRTQKSQSSS